MAAFEFQVLRRDQVGEMARLLPAGTAEIGVQLVEPLRVLSLRHMAGGAEAVAAAAAAAGVPSLPGAGRFNGDEPWVLWRSLSEWLLIGTSDRAAADVLRALPAGPQALAYALDQSAGSIAFALQGSALDKVLHRLLDASAVPHQPGEGTRARLVDIAAIVLRLSPQCAWLIADRANDHYLAQWIAYATDATKATS